MPTEPGTFSELDQFDRKIIEALLEDGRMSNTDLAEGVGLSNTHASFGFAAQECQFHKSAYAICYNIT